MKALFVIVIAMCSFVVYSQEMGPYSGDGTNDSTPYQENADTTSEADSEGSPGGDEGMEPEPEVVVEEKTPAQCLKEHVTTVAVGNILKICTNYYPDNIGKVCDSICSAGIKKCEVPLPWIAILPCRAECTQKLNNACEGMNWCIEQIQNGIDWLKCATSEM